jgi:hypothetical protein
VKGITIGSNAKREDESDSLHINGESDSNEIDKIALQDENN